MEKKLQYNPSFNLSELAKALVAAAFDPKEGKAVLDVHFTSESAIREIFKFIPSTAENIDLVLRYDLEPSAWSLKTKNLEVTSKGDNSA